MTTFGNVQNNTNIKELTVDVDGQSVTLGQLVQKVNTLEHQDGGGDGIDNTRLTTVENGLTSIQSRIQQMEDVISGLHPSSQGGSEGSGETTEIQQAILALNQRLAELEQQLNAHLSDKGNPHAVTKSQVGLGNVKNQTVTVTSSSVSDGTTTFSQFDPSSINQTISQIQTNKQDKLVSGTSIKTLNGQSLLGSGNIQISSGSGSTEPQDTTELENRMNSISQTLDQETENRETVCEQLGDRIDNLEYDMAGRGSLSRYNISTLTQDEYDALEEKDASTLYLITTEEEVVEPPPEEPVIDDPPFDGAKTRFYWIDNGEVQRQDFTLNGEITEESLAEIEMKEYGEWEHPISRVDFGSLVTGIGDNAFSGCSNLKNVNLHDGIQTIGNFAFFNDTSISHIELPENLTQIGDMAFQFCTCLNSITIPGMVESIGDRAFRGCTSLKTVRIPDNVTSIGDQAFDGCHDDLVVYVNSQSVKEKCMEAGIDEDNIVVLV